MSIVRITPFMPLVSYSCVKPELDKKFTQAFDRLPKPRCPSGESEMLEKESITAFKGVGDKRAAQVAESLEAKTIGELKGLSVAQIEASSLPGATKSVLAGIRGAMDKCVINTPIVRC